MEIKMARYEHLATTKKSLKEIEYLLIFTEKICILSKQK